jgi:hypothetical protein
VFHFSKGISHLELLIEFFWEFLHERADPLVVFLEAVKCLCKFKEYSELVHKENINTYLELEPFKEMMRLKEIRENNIYLIRSKKKFPKITNFKFSERMQELKKNH